MKVIIQKKTIMITIILFIFCVNLCVGQSNNLNVLKNDTKLIKMPVIVGLGFLHPSFNSPLPLYRNENDSIPIDTLSFKRDEDGVWHYNTKNMKPFEPYQIYGGDSPERAERKINRGLARTGPKLVFRVLDANDSFYQIVVNENSFETVVIRKNPNYGIFSEPKWEVVRNRTNADYFIYETWEHYLLRVEYVYFDVDYTAYDKPEGNIIFEKTDRNFTPYQVTEIRDNWIKVKIPRHYLFSRFEGMENWEGWVKWRNDEEILIRINEYFIE